MGLIVVDASVLAIAVGDDGTEGAAARIRLAEGDLVAPDLVDVKTMAVPRRRWLAGDLSEPRFAQSIGDLADVPVRCVHSRPLLPRMFELRFNVTAKRMIKRNVTA